MVKFGGRCTALAFALALVFAFSASSSLSVATAQEPYNVTVVARCDIEAGGVVVPIYMDGVASGFLTPHEFVGLTGFHNFSVPEEHASGHFVSDPPFFHSDSNESLSVSSEGVNWIIIGPPGDPTSLESIEFSYGSNPFIENSRGTFEPGALAKLGIRVHMDPSRIASGHLEVYDQDWPIENNTTPPFYASDFTISGVEPAYVSFGIPTNGHIGTWGYTIGIKDSHLDTTVNATFEVAFRPVPVTISFPSGDPLPYSSFEVGNTRYAFFQNPNASDIVLYVGGGTIGKIGGPTPINGYSDVSDRSSATYRIIRDLVVNGFNVVTPQGPWEGLAFPSELVHYLRSQGVHDFYAIGHSAGGVVIANSVITNPELFARAVIADAPLTQASTGFYFTDLSIRSESVAIPHLLVWGRGDDQASLDDAYAWMDHANQSLATLRIYEYDHDWAGTAAEIQVSNQIISFLTQKPLKMVNSRSEIELAVSHPILSKLVEVGLHHDTSDLSNFQNLIVATRFGSSLMEGLGAYRTVLKQGLESSIGEPIVGEALSLMFYPVRLMMAAGALAVSPLPAELAAVAAATIVSSLVGATYFGVPLSIIIARNSNGRRIARKLGIPVALLVVCCLVTSFAAEVFGSRVLLVYSANAMVLATLVGAALFTFRIIPSSANWRRKDVRVS